MAATFRVRRARSVRALLVALGVAGVAAACWSPASSSPSATVAPTPPPSPSPSPDPVSGFLAQAVEVQANGSSTVSGALTADGSAGAVEGELEFDGRDSRVLLTLTLGDRSTTIERIERLGEAWSRTLPGPWLTVDDPLADDQTLVATLASIESVDDAGTELRNGRSLHRLRPDPGAEIPPAALGLDRPDIRGPQLTLEFLVDGDGTPVVLVLTGAWTLVVDGAEKPAEAVLEFEFEDWGRGDVSIDPPDDVWVTYVSDDLGYSMAHPEGWAVTRSDGQDSFGRDGAAFVYVAPQNLTTAITSEQFRDAVIEASETDLGAAPESVAPTTLGGQPAYRATYHTTDKAGTAIAVFDYLTARGTVGWEVYLVTLAGESEARDLAFLETFVASFAFID